MQNTKLSEQPVSHIVWRDGGELFANDYNPNHVAPVELLLLKKSMLEDGWTLPLICLPSGEIVDGFHRWHLTKHDKDVFRLTDGYCPVVHLENVSRGDRIFSTVRYNRARGQHYVKQMAVIVNELKNVHHLSDDEIRVRMGMDQEEIERLYHYGNMLERGSQEDFNKGWVPG